MTAGALAELESGAALVDAVRALRRIGYRDLDAYTPYPVHGLEEALALPRSRLPWIVVLVAFAGAAGAFAVQWYVNAVDYPLDVGGRPGFAVPAFAPITFETGVLAAAFAAFFGLFFAARLPRLSHPLFAAEGFDRASIDRFFLAVDARRPPKDRSAGGIPPPRFDAETVRRDLAALGATRIQFLDGKS